jgi:hypothetical protein
MIEAVNEFVLRIWEGLTFQMPDKVNPYQICATHLCPKSAQSAAKKE